MEQAGCSSDMQALSFSSPAPSSTHSPCHPHAEQESRAKEKGIAWRHRGTDLAVTLPRDRVTHAGFGASLVAVAPPAVRVVVVARGTEVTLSPDDVGLAPGWTQEPEELSELFSPPFCTFPPFSLLTCPTSRDQGCCQMSQGSLTCTGHCPRRSLALSAPARQAGSSCSPHSR